MFQVIVKAFFAKICNWNTGIRSVLCHRECKTLTNVFCDITAVGNSHSSCAMKGKQELREDYLNGVMFMIWLILYDLFLQNHVTFKKYLAIKLKGCSKTENKQ